MTITTNTTNTAPDVVLRSRRGYVTAGLTAAVTASLVTTLAAAAARAGGVNFEIPDGGESIPLLGISQATFMFSVVGLVLAVALRRWSPRPAATFVRITVTLTALSLVPPFLYDANVATSLTLVVLHLLAAVIVIPVIARRVTD